MASLSMVRADTTRHLSRMGEVESRGARPGEGLSFAAEPAEPSVLRPGSSPLPPLPNRLADSHKAGALSLPPCGGGPTRPKAERGGGGRAAAAGGRARGGAPGIKLSVEAGQRCISRRGKAHAIRQARPLRLTDFESRVGKVLHARRPPSRSAFGRVGPPHKGEEGREAHPRGAGDGA